MKQMKILSVVTIALALGLTACGGKSPCKKHTWGEWTITKEETCTEKGSKERECTVCGEKQNQDIAAAHKWGDWNVTAEATCTEKGSETRTCSRCNESDTRDIDLAPHQPRVDAEGNEIIEWTTEPSCDAAGVDGHRTCSVCGTAIPVSSAESAALGHNFRTDAEGNIEFTWTVEPSCDAPGVGTKHCERCGQDIAATEEEAKALGHDVEAIGGETTPTDGTAAVRLYNCKRCHETFMGFLANEVTNESKTHVKFEPETVSEGQEQGARFLGRPIGNAIALDSNGTSVNQQNGEVLYCSTETGDFIEYAFRLNAEQAATLSTCRLYCDAQPADYLNGTDFWAYGASNDEWTPGYYIDGGDERFQTNEDGTPMMVNDHARAGFDSQPGAELDSQVRMGKRIEDYRYVLYVDDTVVDFDPDTKNPTQGRDTAMVRGEFELPYTFHLHEGLNKIKFVMAGGYRSLFYKCIFRPYVAPTPVTVNEATLEVREGQTAQITSSMEGLKFASSNSGVASVDANGIVTGVKAGNATITVSKDGNYKPASVQVTVLEKEGVINLNLTDGVIAPAEGGVEVYNSSSSGTWYRNFQKDSTVTYTFQSTLAGKFDIQLGLRGSNIVLADNFNLKVNNVDVTLSGTVNTSYSAVEYVVGQANLNVGENTMVFTTLASNEMYLKSLKLSPASNEPPAHVHNFGAETDVAAKGEGYVGYKTSSCSEDSAKRISIRALDGSFVGTSANKTGNSAPLDGYMKLASNDMSISYKFDYAGAATTAKLYQYGYMDNFSSNGERTYTSQQSNHLGQNGCNFGVKFNNSDVTISAETKATTYSQFFNGATVSPGGNGNSNLAACYIGEVQLANGDNTFEFTRYDSFNISISHFYLVIE